MLCNAYIASRESVTMTALIVKFDPLISDHASCQTNDGGQRLAKVKKILTLNVPITGLSSNESRLGIEISYN
jgi:hypothetical protein